MCYLYGIIVASKDTTYFFLFVCFLFCFSKLCLIFLFYLVILGSGSLVCELLTISKKKKREQKKTGKLDPKPSGFQHEVELKVEITWIRS